MPTYEYVCTDCGKPLEVFQSFTEDSLTECPECTGRLRKIYGNVGVSFKGAGFYKTDSRSSSASKPAAAATETSSSSESPSSSTPSETKTTSTSSDSSSTSSSDSSSSTSSTKAS